MAHKNKKENQVEICCFDNNSNNSSSKKDFEEVDLEEQIKKINFQLEKQAQEKEAAEENVDPFSESEPNLDSGYAWVILIVMFLLSSTTSGTSRVYGLVYARQISINYYDHEQASWPIATASTIENLAGVLTPALAQFLSWRQIQLLSTSLFIISNLGAYFSDSLLIDILCLGVIQGLALSSGTVLLLAINNDYFERFRTTAYGIAMSGATCGLLFLCPVVNLILDSDPQTFRPVYLFIALVLVLNLILSLFIKPRASTKSYKKFIQEREAAEKLEKAAKRNNKKDSTVSFNKVVNTNGNVKDKRLSVVRRLSRLENHIERKHSVASVNYAIRIKRNSQFSSYSADNNNNRNVWATKSCLVTGSEDDKNKRFFANQQRSFHAGSNFDRNNRNTSSTTTVSTTLDSSFEDNINSPESIIQKNQILNNNNNNNFDEVNWAAKQPHPLDISSKIVIDNHNSPKEEKDRKKSEPEVESKHQEAEKVFTFLDSIKLLSSPYLHCVWIMLTIYYLVSRVYLIILADFGKDHGLTHSQSYQLLNYWSIGELLGRVVLATLIDLRWISVKSCIIVTCTFLASSIMLMVLLENFYIYAICSTVTAALVSLEYMLINALMVEYLGKNKAIGCYSIAALISSLVLFGRPTLIGIFRDKLGSYDGLLILLSITCLLFGLLFALLEPLFVRYWPKTRQQLSRF